LKRRGVKPIKKNDHRYKDGRPHLAFEAEAIGQAEIVAMLRKRLDELLPEPLAAVLEREARQRRQVERWLRKGK
jgi:hypothetical protein